MKHKLDMWKELVWKVQALNLRNRWITIAACFYRAHAVKIYNDAVVRWPKRQFRMNGWQAVVFG
jgi:hypothetical protein